MKRVCFISDEKAAFDREVHKGIIAFYRFNWSHPTPYQVAVRIQATERQVQDAIYRLTQDGVLMRLTKRADGYKIALDENGERFEYDDNAPAPKHGRPQAAKSVVLVVGTYHIAGTELKHIGEVTHIDDDGRKVIRNSRGVSMPFSDDEITPYAPKEVTL